MDRRAVKVEPSDYDLYRRSLRPDGTRHSVLASVRAGDDEKAGLGCTLELQADGRHVVAGIQPGGACAEHGIQTGATILSVDGVPLRSMSVEQVRQLTMGLVGTHVCIRFRPPGVHAEFPPLERVLTRMPASFAAPGTSRSSTASRGPDTSRAMGQPVSTQDGARGGGVANGLETWRSSATVVSLSQWLREMGLFKSARKEDAESNEDETEIRGSLISHRVHSSRASQRAEFFSEGSEFDPRPFNPPSGTIRQIADQHMAETHRSHSTQARPVTIPPSHDIAKRPQSVSTAALQHVVQDILDRRSRRFAHLLHGDIRPSKLAAIADQHAKRPALDEDLDVYAHDARIIAASSVLSSDGLESGRNYIYPQEVGAGALQFRCALRILKWE